MGKQNRHRRAAKARARERSREHRHGGGGGAAGWFGHLGDRERVQLLLASAIDAGARGDADGARLGALALAEAPPQLVQREGAAEIRRLLPLAWDNGWQPAELVRQGRRAGAGARTGRLVAAAVLADHAPRAPATLHPTWARQVEELAEADRPAQSAAGGDWLGGFVAREGLDAAGAAGCIVDVLVVLGGLRRLAVLVPPPGTGTSGAAAPGAPTAPPPGIDDAVLAKVRALLAQAESTTFEAEAEAFTAKAQELMARHAIDTAVVWDCSGRDERPVTIRIAVDDPYVDAKAQLLHVVAEHSRCRAVQMTRYALVSVTGFAADVAAVEVLFTSLLVQSQVALRAEGAAAGPGSRARSRSFRSTFLVAYAVRIGERLAAVNEAVTAEVGGAPGGAGGGGGGGGGADLLPVLAARADAVDDAVAELYGEVRTARARGSLDPLGWSRGRDAADRAQLRAGDLAEGRRALGA